MQLPAALLEDDPLVRFILVSAFVPSGSVNLDDVLEVLERVLAEQPGGVRGTHLA